MTSHDDDNATEVWIYHERQEALLCGQHTLNNLLQACVFTTSSLSEIAQQLDELELAYMAANNEGGIQSKDYLKRVAEGSGNVDPWGNFSIQVLRSALEHRYQISLPNVRQEGILSDSTDITQMDGFVCNRESHWYAIRKINGRFWDLNSTNEYPLAISHFQVATHMEDLIQKGYSVFCVLEHSLPDLQQNRTLFSHYWWKESDLLNTTTKTTPSSSLLQRRKRKQSTNNNTHDGGDRDRDHNDAWKNVGSGIRLDGKSTTTTTAMTPSVVDLVNDHSIDEEELLQMALAASLQSHTEKAKDDIPNDDTMIALSSEPEEGLEGVVKIQFRFSNKRIVRRFYKKDLVSTIYQFCQQESSSSSSSKKSSTTALELRSGFPPKSLDAVQTKTIEEAQLAGESIQVVW